MDLRYLRYFVAVAEELNLTRAAQRLHTAQPTLSVQIRRLETEVGVELFSREGRGIKLTEAGRVFLQQARKTLVEANRGITLARQAAHGELGHLSIGYNTPAEFRVFPKIVPEFKKKWPNVHLAFHNLNITQQLEGVRREELDLGFVWLPIPMQEFDVQELTHETLVAVVPAEHRLASVPSVSASDLSREPLILPTRLMDSETYREIEQLFARERAVINVAYELETLISVLNFVAMGSACSILADYTRRIHQDGVVYKPLRPSDIVKTLGMIKRKDRGDLTEVFYRFIADRFQDDGSSSRSTSTPSNSRK